MLVNSSHFHRNGVSVTAVNFLSQTFRISMRQSGMPMEVAAIRSEFLTSKDGFFEVSHTVQATSIR